MLAFLLPALQTLYAHRFQFDAPASAKSVFVAGTFNNWNSTANAMTRLPGSTTWSETLNLPSGQYFYKFVVDGNQWVTDPNAKSINDGNGNMNSELWITPPDYSTPARLGDGKVTWSAVKHQIAVPYVNWDKDYENGTLRIELRVRPNDVQSVQLVEEDGTVRNMEIASQDPVYQFDSATLTWNGNQPIRYTFKIKDGDLIGYFGPNGPSKDSQGNFFTIDKSNVPQLNPPSWVQHTVFYQIFPDRFANGDLTPTEELGPQWEQKKDFSKFVGGNIAGMEQHLDYLYSLGISGIYFNPIFESSVYHGYETVDYLKIDPHEGTNEQFSDLTHQLKDHGIRTVLDGVFNHTSTKFFAFADVVKNGAASKYVNWYTFYGFPVKIGNPPNYKAWWNYPSLPKLNHSNPDVIDYLLNVPAFCNQHAEIAGWRLDAAQEIQDAFWKKFYAKVKGINPSDWIVGEDWGDSSHYTNASLWDSTMNYPFLFAVWNFVGKGGTAHPSDLASRLMQIFGWYPPQIDRNLMNLVDSHDTIRILTECDNNPKLRNLAAAIEFAWVGAPTIYYGDELGMEGGKDPDNRNPMEWSKDSSSNPTLRYYKTLIQARNNSPELQMGDPKILSTDDQNGTLAFARIYNEIPAIFAANRSDAEETVSIKAPAGIKSVVLKNIFTNIDYRVTSDATFQLRLDPESAAILVPASEVKGEELSGLNSETNSLTAQLPNCRQDTRQQGGRLAS